MLVKGDEVDHLLVAKVVALDLPQKALHAEELVEVV